MGEDELVIETWEDYRRARREYAGVDGRSDRPGREADRLRGELDGARLRYLDALRITGRRGRRRVA
jgi:hypothetical protein